MEVRFSLTRDDVWHYIIYVYTQQRRRTLWLLLFFFALIILLPLLTSLSSFSIFDLLPSLMLVIMLLLIFPFMLLRTASRAAGWGGEQVVSITPRGIQEKSDQGEGIRNWSAVKNIGQDKYNLYFIVKTSSSRVVQGLIIPRRAFATPQDAEMFLNQARQYFQQAGPTQPSLSR